MAQSQYCVKSVLWLNATMQERKPQDQDKFIVRLPEGMREKIRISAEANRRSMNAEIIARLDESFEAELGMVLLRLNLFSEPQELYDAALRLEAMADLARQRADAVTSDPSAR